MNVSERIIVARKVRSGELKPRQIDEFLDDLRWGRAIDSVEHRDVLALRCQRKCA